MTDHPGRTEVRNYYRLPLADDPRDSVTLLRIETEPDGGVRVHLHRAVNRTSFSMRFGSATEPVWHAVAEPRTTLVAPAPSLPGLTAPERVLAEVGQFLSGVVVGDGGIYAWGFDGLMPNDEWVLHLTQLSALHQWLEPARRSDVADDPRVVARMAEIAEAAVSHATALGGWLDKAREVAAEVMAAAEAELREQRVLDVLHRLDGHAVENTRARPNPDLPRISTR